MDKRRPKGKVSGMRKRWDGRHLCMNSSKCLESYHHNYYIFVLAQSTRQVDDDMIDPH